VVDAGFRLVEQGELEMDEGVEVLQETLRDISLDWIEGIDEITAVSDESWHDASVAGTVAPGGPFNPLDLDIPAVGLIVTLASRSYGELSEAILSIRTQLSELGWTPSFQEETEGRPARRAAAAKRRLKR